MLILIKSIWPTKSMKSSGFLKQYSRIAGVLLSIWKKKQKKKTCRSFERSISFILLSDDSFLFFFHVSRNNKDRAFSFSTDCGLVAHRTCSAIGLPISCVPAESKNRSNRYASGELTLKLFAYAPDTRFRLLPSERTSNSRCFFASSFNQRKLLKNSNIVPPTIQDIASETCSLSA